MQVVQDSLRTRGVSKKASAVILNSGRGTTQKQYQVYLKKWYSFCSKRGFDPCSVSSVKALDFLAELFEQGLGYSALNTARSALSQVLPPQAGVPFGELPLTKQFMKGVFQEKPSLPRYTVTWDPVLLLSFLRSQSPNGKLDLKMLTLKTVTLLTLLSAQRVQTVHFFDIRNISITDSIVKVSIGDKLKQTRPGYHLHELEFPAYSPDQQLCPVSVVKEYLSRTKPLRGEITTLFISFVRPCRSVSKSTISRWVKTTLGLAGVDLTRFKPHSIRAASSSAASQASVPLATILRTAGWSSECTFAQYYQKEVHKQGTYATTILDSSLSTL